MGQDGEIKRVGERIGHAVLDFCRPYAGTGQTFFADDLRRYVRQVVGEVAPGSPDRILRMLRQQREINYCVVSRSESIYQVLWMKP